MSNASLASVSSRSRPGAWRGRAWLAAALLLGGLAVRAAEPVRQWFDLPAGDAAVTLRQLSEAARTEILFSAEIVRGLRTPPVRGEFTALEAGNRMLAGTQLQALQDGRTGALAVRRAPAAPRSAAAPPARSVAMAGPRRSAAAGAILRGRVYNVATGRNLEGAAVRLAGGRKGVTTERDGTFALRGLPPGLVTVRVSYPGLDEASVTVDLASGGTTTRDIPLTAGIYEMEKYAVTAIREGDAAAIARQERSLVVMNAISTDAFGNIAKGDLGTFLQRLPGVVGEYGGSAVDAIFVRGLAPEFTTVMMDGTRTASANPDSRSQHVSGLPSGAIESVELIKTPTADMDADSLGGIVNLRTRSGFDRTGRTLIVNAATSCNQTMGRHLDPSGGGRLFYPHVSAEFSDVYALRGRRLGVVVTGTYQEVGDGLQTIRAEFAPNWDYAGPTRPRRVVYADQEYHLNKRADLHAKVDYKLGRDSALGFAAGFTRFANTMEQVRPQYVDGLIIDPVRTTDDTWVFSRARYRSNRDFRHLPSDQWRFQLHGRHALGFAQLAWDLSHSDSRRTLDRMAGSARSNHDFELIFDRRFSREFPALAFGAGVPPPEDRFTNLFQVSAAGAHEESTDRIRGARLDLTREFAGRWPVRLKTGFRLREQRRARDYSELGGTLPAGSYAEYRDFRFTHGWLDGRYPATPLFDTRAFFRDAALRYLPGGRPDRPAVRFAYDPARLAVNLDTAVAGSLLGDYQTRETIPAAYVQAEVRLAAALQMTAGIRYEETRTRIASRLEQTGAATPEARYAGFKTVAANYDTWFPNLQFRYEPIRHLTLRAALSTTIGRPRMADLVGRFVVDETGQALSFSNPSLLPQQARNFDLSAEYYFEPVGVVSVGVFRKRIDRYVASTSFRVAGNEFGLNLADYAGWTGTTRVNAGAGTVEGVELNYVQQLGFLPAALRGFGVMANWTILRSAGDYHGLVGPLPFANRLTGLRPRSGNAGLSYNRGRWDLRLMWNYADTYLASLDVGDPSNSEFIGRRAQWDGFARFKLTRTFNVFVDVINLAETTRGRYRGLYRDDRRAQTNLFPRSVAAGVQARF
jgi:TonB-dependent receptor